MAAKKTTASPAVPCRSLPFPAVSTGQGFEVEVADGFPLPRRCAGSRERNYSGDALTPILWTPIVGKFKFVMLRGPFPGTPAPRQDLTIVFYVPP
jgi:hypothetical protein